VPWLQLKAERGIELRYVPLTDDGLLVLDDLEELVDGAKLVGVTCMSNVLGTLNACQAFGGLLRASGGAVVNVASQAALVSLPQQAAYTASKGAVAALTRSVAIDWAAHGVRVNAVAPGFTVTPMTEAFFENETFTQAATRRIPIGRLLLADEIAGAIVFLASPLASAITGVVLPVDGGWTAGEPALPW